MGFITDEWISPGVKTGNFAVAQVRLVASRPTSEFSKRHGLVMRLTAESAVSPDYQVVHFDATELLQLLVTSLREAGTELRAGMVKAMLGEMSDTELASALEVEVSRRQARAPAG